MQISSITNVQLSRLLSTTSSRRFRRNNNFNVARRPFSASKRSGGKPMQRPSIKIAGAGSVEGVWYTTSGSRNSLDMGRYGLKRLDYKTLDPPVWMVPPHPPTKSIQEKVLFPLTLMTVGGFGVWAYMNPEDEDMKDYWKRVETGQILVEEEEDDDEWDDEEE